MKKESGNQIKLGVFVSVGLVLLIAGIYFIGKKQQFFHSTLSASCVFKNVNGLQEGNNVRFAGIDVGTIDYIEILSDTAVKVSMIINDDVQKFIKKDAVAAIGTDGLMGNKILTISPGNGSSEMIVDKDIIKTAQPAGIDEIVERIKTAVDTAQKVFNDLSAIMGNIRYGKGAVGKLFMDSAFAKKMDKTITNVEQGSKGFKQNMDAAKNSFFLRGFFKKKKEEEKKKNQKTGNE